MIFSIDNKIVEVAFNQSQCLCVQSYIAITKQKMIEKCLISDYLKIQVFIKIGFMLQAALQRREH